MKIALYKGPPTDLAHKLAHWAVCLFTGSPYSHCELVIGGICYSASAHQGERYDWAGIARFAIPFLPHRSKQWFCSEACGAALGLPNPHKLTPDSFI